MSNAKTVALAGVSTIALAAPALAQSATPGVDLSSFTSAISFAGVTAALLAVASIVVVPELYMKGIRWVLHLVRGA